ncbi:spindle and centriole-associated protein 1 [Ciona intestinalis]
MFHRSRFGKKSSLPMRKHKKNNSLNRPDWDGTVNDLTVHAASPQDILRNQIKRKSKNADAARRELRARKRGIPVDLMLTPGQMKLEMRKLAILRDVLYDHNDLSEVLRRTDETMSSVKDIFQDSSTCKSGNLNMTVMPGQEPNRGAISENQTLNETNDSVGEEYEADSDRYLHLLGDSSNQAPSKLPEDLLHTPQNNRNFPNKEYSALNGTQEVKRTMSRTNFDQKSHEKSDITDNISRISKDASVLQGKLNASSAIIQPKYDDLKSAMQNVATNISSFEEKSGRQVQKMQVSDGLGGFTASLLDAVTRLTSYVGEGEMKVNKVKQTVVELEDKLAHQTAVNDALTLELMNVVEQMKQHKSVVDEMKIVVLQLNNKNIETLKDNETLEHQVAALNKRVEKLEEKCEPVAQDEVNGVEFVALRGETNNTDDSGLKSDMTALLTALKSQNAKSAVPSSEASKTTSHFKPYLLETETTEEASHTIASVQSHLKHLQLQHQQAQQRMNELTQHIQPTTPNTVQELTTFTQPTAVHQPATFTQPPAVHQPTSYPQIQLRSISPPCKDTKPNPQPSHGVQYNLDFLQSDNDSSDLLEGDDSSSISISSASLMSPQVPQHQNKEILTGIKKTQVSLEDRISELNKQHAEAQSRLQRLVSRRRGETRS